MKKPTRAENFDLSVLLDGIDAGSVVLPNFQRDFDWYVSDIRSLVGTVLRGWPLGSLLLIEGGAEQDFYDPRPFEKAPGIASTIDVIVLDGQQRLTSLYHAFRGKGDFVFAVRQDMPVLSIDEVDKAIVAIKRKDWPAQPRDQHSAGFIPVAALESAEKFYEWRDSAMDGASADIVRTATEKYRDHLAGANSYRVPAVVIGTDAGPEAVARIFERVNRTGMKLGAFDLMVAKSFSVGFNLRKLWDEAQEKNPLLADFLAHDGLPVLSSLALRLRGDVRQSAVLELSGEEIKQHWFGAVEHVEAAVELLTNRLGVLDSAWLPYRSMLPLIAAIDADLRIESQSDLIERWFWATAIGRRYDEGSNTTIVSDYRRLVTAADPIRSPIQIVREAALESTRGQQGAFHRTFLSALGRNLTHRANQPLTGTKIVARSEYSRDDQRLENPPLHLRTLGFVLDVDHAANTWIAVPDQFGVVDLEGDPAVVLDARLRQYVRAVENWVGSRVAVVSAADVADDELFVGADEELL